VQGRPTLFLGKDDYVAWELRGGRLSGAIPFYLPSADPVVVRPRKPIVEGSPLDFDTIEPRGLDLFRYAVTTRTGYASRAPANWRRILDTRFYTLWERRGPTSDRQVLDEQIAPGAVLRCDRPADRALSRRRGRALVRPAPVVGDPGGWIRPTGRPAPPNVADTLQSGDTVTHDLELPLGRWEISLQYLGGTSLRVRAPGLDRTMPQNPELPGPWWSVGTVAGGRTIRLSVTAEAKPFLSTRRPVALGAVAATRVDRPDEVVPLSRACGRYVDSYDVVR
jgi:hypothetical protein